MKYSVLFFLIGYCFTVWGQKSPREWDERISSYDIYNAEKKDSLLIWADILEKSGYRRAEAYASRFRGFYYDYDENSKEALKHYLEFRKKAGELGDPTDELTSVADLVYIHLFTGQHLRAKAFIKEILTKYEPEVFDQKKLSVIYNNLGQCYLNEEKRDSALLYYEKSLKIKTELKDSSAIAYSKINLASLYVKNKDFRKALELSEENIAYFTGKSDTDVWYNLVNKSGALNGLGQNKESLQVLLESLTLAQKLDSKNLRQLSHEKLAALYFELGQYQQAYEELRRSNELKDQLLNEQTNNRIAELQEEYHATERERENQLLTTQLESQRNRQLALAIGLLAVITLAGITGFALYKNKKKNELIEAQNRKLTELNTEKNHLMSVVSHDLSSPFSAIKLWAESLPDSENETRQMIVKTADHGLKNIRSLLTIDKQELREVNLERIDLSTLFAELAGRFRPMAEASGLQFRVRVEQDQEELLTDRNLLFRVLENLLSNAIKYSEKGVVSLRCYQTTDFIHFEVSDQGKGIPAQEVSTIFNRYQTSGVSLKKGDTSHGLGLFIVKRIADELGGTVKVRSTVGKGSDFTFSLPL